MSKSKEPKELKVTYMSFEEFAQADHFPANYYFKSATQYVFVHTSKREVATKYIADNYDGRYTIRSIKMEKPKSTNYVR